MSDAISFSYLLLTGGFGALIGLLVLQGGRRPAATDSATGGTSPYDVFLSYATKDRAIAEEVHLAVVGAGYRVFFDKDQLSPAGDYNSKIKEAVLSVDVFVFLVSPDSVAPRTYARTELKLARDRWPHPKNHVLPVLIRRTPLKRIPAYLRGVTILEPEGSVPAEVALAVQALAREQRAEFETVQNTDNGSLQ